MIARQPIHAYHLQELYEYLFEGRGKKRDIQEVVQKNKEMHHRNMAIIKGEVGKIQAYQDPIKKKEAFEKLKKKYQLGIDSIDLPIEEIHQKLEAEMQRAVMRFESEVHQSEKIKTNAVTEFFTDLFGEGLQDPRFRQALFELQASHIDDILFSNLDPFEPHSSYLIAPALNQWLSNENNKNYFDSSQEVCVKNHLILFKLFKLIGDFVEKNNDNQNSLAMRHAVNAYAMFIDEKKFHLRDLDAYMKCHNFYKGNKKPLHDALDYTLPAKLENLPKWRKLFQASAPKDAKKWLALAPRIETALGHVPVDGVEAMDCAKVISYQNRNKNPELAGLFVIHGLTEKAFEDALLIEKEKKQQDDCPDVSVDGVDVGYPGYHLVKLPVNDLNAYVLGKITNCCQYMGGHSEECVIDGLTLSTSCFYVLLKAFKKESDTPPLIGGAINYQDYRIIGQAYAWIAASNNFTFDSWENLNRDVDDVKVKPFLEAWANKVMDRENNTIDRVTIGLGGNTPQDFGKVLSPEIMREGTQYGDSSEQGIIAENVDKLASWVFQIRDKLYQKLNINDDDWQSQGFVDGINSKILPSICISRAMCEAVMRILNFENSNEKSIGAILHLLPQLALLEMSQDSQEHIDAILHSQNDAERYITFLRKMVSCNAYHELKDTLMGFYLYEGPNVCDLNSPASLASYLDLLSRSIRKLQKAGLWNDEVISHIKSHLTEVYSIETWASVLCELKRVGVYSTTLREIVFEKALNTSNPDQVSGFILLGKLINMGFEKQVAIDLFQSNMMYVDAFLSLIERGITAKNIHKFIEDQAAKPGISGYVDFSYLQRILESKSEWVSERIVKIVFEDLIRSEEILQHLSEAYDYFSKTISTESINNLFNRILDHPECIEQQLRGLGRLYQYEHFADHERLLAHPESADFLGAVIPLLYQFKMMTEDNINTLLNQYKKNPHRFDTSLRPDDTCLREAFENLTRVGLDSEENKLDFIFNNKTMDGKRTNYSRVIDGWKELKEHNIYDEVNRLAALQGVDAAYLGFLKQQGVYTEKVRDFFLQKPDEIKFDMIRSSLSMLAKIGLLEKYEDLVLKHYRSPYRLVSAIVFLHESGKLSDEVVAALDKAPDDAFDFAKFHVEYYDDPLYLQMKPYFFDHPEEAKHVPRAIEIFSHIDPEVLTQEMKNYLLRHSKYAQEYALAVTSLYSYKVATPELLAVLKNHPSHASSIYEALNSLYWQGLRDLEYLRAAVQYPDAPWHRIADFDDASSKRRAFFEVLRECETKVKFDPAVTVKPVVYGEAISQTFFFIKPDEESTPSLPNPHSPQAKKK